MLRDHTMIRSYISFNHGSDIRDLLHYMRETLRGKIYKNAHLIILAASIRHKYCSTVRDIIPIFDDKQKKHIHQNKELSFSRAQPPVARPKVVSQSNPLISLLANHILALPWDQISKQACGQGDAADADCS